MVEIGIKALYTIVLLTITLFCAREAWLVWFERPLQIGQFAGTRDGADAPGMADSFRRLVVQQQNVLFDLYRGADSKPGEFRVSSGDVLAIHTSDLARIPGSALDSLKIEAAGVNVTSLLTTLRRWIVAPNEITGSVDQISQQIIVSANWGSPPYVRGTQSWQMLVLPTQATLQGASFDLACRILFARIPPKPPWENVSEGDFCAFSTALSKFRFYLTARGVAANDADVKVATDALSAAQKLTDRLVADKTNVIFAYKLGGYLELEQVNNLVNPNPNQIRPMLDKAQSLFQEYLERFAKLSPDGVDTDVQEKLASLATRRGSLQASGDFEQVGLGQVKATAFLKAINPALKETIKTSPTPLGPSALHPGSSIGPAGGKTAGALGCFVEKDGKIYLLSVAYLVGAVGDIVVSPSFIDVAEEHSPIGKVVDVDGAFALVEIAGGFDARNDQIKGLAPPPGLDAPVHLIGRNMGISKATITAVVVDGIRIDLERGYLALDGAVQASRLGLPGDGGGAVLDSEDRLVGLLVASSASASFILPVRPFMDRKALTLAR
jgi:hypothetical protein